MSIHRSPGRSEWRVKPAQGSLLSFFFSGEGVASAKQVLTDRRLNRHRNPNKAECSDDQHDNAGRLGIRDGKARLTPMSKGKRGWNPSR